jgi:lipopolysaccharide export system protein LptA
MNRTAILALACLIGGTAALAQGLSALRGHNADAPADISADRIELQERANRAVFSGRVHVTQGDLTMDAARMTVAYTRGTGENADPVIQRIDASGGVTVVDPSETAKGSYGIYDLNRRLITLIGGVTLTRGGNSVRGARLVINLDTGRASVDGNAVGGAPGTTSSGGRVSGRFSVPQRSNPAQ